MTFNELMKQCQALQAECNEKQSALRRQYAAEHNPVKVGDIVTDHYHTIKVERMSVYGHPQPYIKYSGPVMTKQGVLAKRQPRTEEPVFQCNLKLINNKPYTFVKEN